MKIKHIIYYSYSFIKFAFLLVFLIFFLRVTFERYDAYNRCSGKYKNVQEQIQMYFKELYADQAGEQNIHTMTNTNKDKNYKDIDNDHTDKKQDQTRFLMSSAFEVSGLGNLMFQYASLIGIASHYNMTPIVYSKLRLFDCFQLDVLESDVERPGVAWGKILNKKASSFEERILSVKSIDQNLELVGFFQSWIYFADVDTRIRKEFRFPEKVLQKAKGVYSSAVEKYVSANKVVPTTVGLHIRRGDMTSPRFRDIGYTTVNSTYISKAIKYMTGKFKHVLFLVCSDDTQWVKENVQVYHNVTMFDVVSNSHEDVVDLALLGLTDHFIMSTGTFSWWAGWLSRGEVVYWKEFPRKGSKLEQMFSEDRKDYYYPGWVAL